MKITVRAIPGAKELKIVELGASEFKVYIPSPSREDKANTHLKKIIAKHFNVAPSLVRISRGIHSKIKILEIDVQEPEL